MNLEYKKNDGLSSYRTPWRLMTEEEKKEIIDNSVKRKEEKQKLENIKNADIITGKQKTVDCWE